MSALRKLLDEATPGPWHMWTGSVCRIGPTPEGAVIDSEMLSTADANLIALAPSLAAALLKAEEALEGVAHMGYDAPATYAGDDLAWANRRSGMMQSIARAAVSEISSITGGPDARP